MTEKHLFDVIVVATMSAGKSTLINALIGHELLHAANEATTATITRIQDKDDVKDFIGSCYDYNGNAIEKNLVVNPDLLKEWNADHQIKNIDLYGDIKGLYNSQSEIVIYDTPGPNNSQDDSHEKLTMEVIDDGNYGLILYILNATQLGINDDLHLLTKIRSSLDKDPKKEIIFVLNKIDQIDEEYESIPSVLENTKNYLEKNGFKEPVILPASAEAALLMRKAIYNLPFTRTERASLRNYHDYYHDNDLNIANSSLPKKDKINIYTHLNGFNNPRKITVKDQTYTSAELHRIYVYSGIGVLSYLIQRKLDKKVSVAPKTPVKKSISITSKKQTKKSTSKR